MNAITPHDGTTRMSHAEIQAEIRHRVISAVQSGQMTQAQAAERFGMTRQRVSQMICDARNGVERGAKFADRMTPSGKPVYEPKETGGYRWTDAALEELREAIEGGQSINAAAAAFGIDPRHVRRRAVAERWVNARSKRYAAVKDRMVEIAPEAKTFAELARRLGVGVTTVRETLRRRAPREHLRMCGVISRADDLADAPAAEPVCWHKRAQDLFPHDPALVRSLARLASFVATTKDGVTVRLLPPRCTVA